jgi:hypothetical protein
LPLNYKDSYKRPELKYINREEIKITISCDRCKELIYEITFEKSSHRIPIYIKNKDRYFYM